MKVYIYILMCVFLASCGVRKPLVGTDVERDSVRVEIRYVERFDTAYVEIPKIVERTVTSDTVSYLDNGYANSEAIVSQGKLYHSLCTGDEKVKIVYRTVYRDSVIYEDRAVYIDRPVMVEREVVRFGRKWQTLLFLSAMLTILLIIKKILS